MAVHRHPDPPSHVEASADVSPEAALGMGCSVWHLAQIRERARVGSGCIIGRGAYIGAGAVLGDNCKIQNYALVYEPAVLGEGVFVGPAAVLTNDRHPRAVNPDLSVKGPDDWEMVGVTVLEGATIGAGSICVAPVRVGRWAVVAAGSVVVRDVPDFSLVAGSPARQIGWVGRTGARLVEGAVARGWVCPVSSAQYRELPQGGLEEVTP